CKLWSRKKPAPTIAYVALKLGQRRTSKAQITTSTEIARRVDGERGKQSAKVTPIAATTARPTNGWRGPLNNFIVRFSSISRGQRKLFEQTREREAKVEDRAQVKPGADAVFEDASHEQVIGRAVLRPK